MTTHQHHPADLAAAYAAVDAWNAAYPPGTPVLAWPGTRDQEPLRTRTRTSAWALINGLPSGVNVVGHPVGIALTHVEHDPTRQPALLDVEFSCPPCPLCGVELEADADSLRCDGCCAAWHADGSDGEWDDPDATRCPATRSFDHQHLANEQCALAAGHNTADHIPADGIGDWTDTDTWCVVIDADGNEVTR